MLNKKLFFITIIFLSVLLVPGLLFAQAKQKITVFPLENPENDLQIEVISKNVQRTVELNLKMMDTYIVENNNVSSYKGDNDWLLDYSVKNKIDNILFGKAEFDKSTGSITLQMSVFNKANKAITLTKTENAETLFDIFKASDLLAIGMIEGFSGLTLGFGELKFTNQGEKGKYSVYIDKVFAGDDLATLSPVIAGTKTIKITQERMFGNYVLYDKKTVIGDKSATEIVFNIPGFLGKESSAISKEEKKINKNWDDKYAMKTVDNSFTKLFKALKTEGYSESEESKKKEVEEKYAAWEKKKGEWGGERITILDKPFGISVFGGGAIANWYAWRTKGFYFDENQNSCDGGKFGISFSANLPYNFALATGFSYSFNYLSFDGQSTDPFFSSSGGWYNRNFDAEIVEIPILIMYRLPGKYVSIYWGPVLQVLTTGKTGYEDSWDSVTNSNTAITDYDLKLASFGGALAFGIKAEMPIYKSFYMELGLCYMKGLNNWLDGDHDVIDQVKIPENTVLTLGFGFKFGN